MANHPRLDLVTGSESRLDLPGNPKAQIARKRSEKPEILQSGTANTGHSSSQINALGIVHGGRITVTV
jgi:hypothetical protein